MKVIHQKQRKSNAGRKPHDVALMFKMLVLQALYNLSDDQTEFQIRDRLSFQRFLGLSPEDTVPDAKTLWLFREQLARHGLIEGIEHHARSLARVSNELSAMHDLAFLRDAKEGAEFLLALMIDKLKSELGMVKL